MSSEKSAEIAERKAAKEAKEAKEKQERFIDMISHGWSLTPYLHMAIADSHTEIRNPLSAVLLSSEDISESIRDKDNIDVDAISEAVETINLCISHQKNIVDDVLSFSKLDASMLSLVPRSCQPSRQLAGSLKMSVCQRRPFIPRRVVLTRLHFSQVPA